MKGMTEIKDALSLTCSQRLMEATQKIQETLRLTKQNPHETSKPFVSAKTRQVFKDQNGISVAETGLVQVAGRAWAGGNPQGSFTDEAGPDASSRFFLNRQSLS